MQSKNQTREATKKQYNKDIINLEIKKNTNIITIENDQDYGEENVDNICDLNEDFQNMEIKKKKIINKNICNKCKINKSMYYVRMEFVCQYKKLLN